MYTTVNEIVNDAAALGTDHGGNAGSWVVESEEQAATLRRWLNDGDPRIDEITPAALSGEWADSMTPNRLREELGVNDDEWDAVCDEACDAYEEAFHDAFTARVEDDISAQLD